MSPIGSDFELLNSTYLTVSKELSCLPWCELCFCHPWQIRIGLHSIMGDRGDCNCNPALCNESKLVVSSAFAPAGRNFATLQWAPKCWPLVSVNWFWFNIPSVFLAWPNLKLYMKGIEIAVINMCSTHFESLASLH